MNTLYSFWKRNDLVWLEPVSNLACRFGISDANLTKACKSKYIRNRPCAIWPKAPPE